jgi:hypothetical protein
LNVLDHSPFVVNFLQGDGYNVRFMVNIGNEYVKHYLLVDGIYPHWFFLCKQFMWTHFVPLQKSYTKDVECAFGMLEYHFHIIVNPC